MRNRLILTAMAKKRIHLTESQIYGLVRKVVNEMHGVSGNAYNNIDRKYASDIKGSYQNFQYDALSREIAEAMYSLALRGRNHSGIRFGKDNHEVDANEVTISVRFDDIDLPVDVFVVFDYYMCCGNMVPCSFSIRSIDVFADIDDYNAIPDEQYETYQNVEDFVKNNIKVQTINSTLKELTAKREERVRRDNAVSCEESLAHRVTESVMRKLRRIR